MWKLEEKKRVKNAKQGGWYSGERKRKNCESWKKNEKVVKELNVENSLVTQVEKKLRKKRRYKENKRILKNVVRVLWSIKVFREFSHYLGQIVSICPLAYITIILSPNWSLIRCSILVEYYTRTSLWVIFCMYAEFFGEWGAQW